jgi:addiction module RelB/DinJ family antitoxin
MQTMNMRVGRKNALAAKKILAGMGLTPRVACDLFLAKIVSHKAIPFPIAMPDSEYAMTEYGLTPADIEASDRRIDGIIAKEKRDGTIREFTGIDSLRG